MVAGPVVVEALGGSALEFDFVVMSVLFPGGSVDDLWFVEMGSGWEYGLFDLFAELGQSEAVHLPL